MTTIKEIKVHGRTRWQVDAGIMDGQRRRQVFETEGQAKKFRTTVERDRRQTGDRWLHLPPHRKDEILRTLEEASEKGVTVEMMWEHWQNTADRPSGTLTIEAYNQFYASKSTSGISPEYLVQLKYQVGNWAEINKERDIATIKASHIEAWLTELKLKPTTRDTHLRRLSSFFEWCTRQDMIKANPCVKIDKVRLITPDPEMLTNEQCASLVATARLTDPGLLTYLGLALFCGIRPHEARRLTHKDIDLDQGIVTLSAAKAKVRNRRIIELTEPAKRCLKDGKRMPTGQRFRSRFEKLRQEAGITHWPHDALRKTCASHFYNLYGIHKAVEQLGHSAEVMLRNYRQLVTKEQSEEWLEIA